MGAHFQSTPSAGERGRAIRAATALIVLVAALAVGVADAGAWAWDPNVTLSGSAHCGLPSATWVYIKASDGEQGWATNGVGHYLFNFHHIGTGTVWVHATFGEVGASCHADFGVNRPTWGTGATRNLIQIIPNGG
jgi:hypothetical protein